MTLAKQFSKILKNLLGFCQFFRIFNQKMTITKTLAKEFTKMKELSRWVMTLMMMTKELMKTMTIINLKTNQIILVQRINLFLNFKFE